MKPIIENLMLWLIVIAAYAIMFLIGIMICLLMVKVASAHHLPPQTEAILLMHGYDPNDYKAMSDLSRFAQEEYVEKDCKRPYIPIVQIQHNNGDPNFVLYQSSQWHVAVSELSNARTATTLSTCPIKGMFAFAEYHQEISQ